MQNKFKHAERNAFTIFGLFPWLGLFAPALLAYPLLVGLLLLNRIFLPLLALLLTMAVAFGLVFFLMVPEPLSNVQLYNIYSTTFGWLILFAVVFLKPQLYIRTSKYIDNSILVFFAVALTLRYFYYLEYKAIVQIMGITFAMYFIYADRANQKILVILYLLASGGRANTVGLVMAWIWDRWKFLRASLSWPALLGVLVLVAGGAAFTFSYDFLEGLRDQGILMKGRTNFWLGLLRDDPGIFGHGAGASLLVMEIVSGQFQLPHNDWLRIYQDFGYAGVLATIIVMFLVMRKGGPQRFATVVLAVSMLFDNTLSYPTAMSAYFIVCLSHAPLPARRKPIRRPRGAILPRADRVHVRQAQQR